MKTIIRILFSSNPLRLDWWIRQLLHDGQLIITNLQTPETNPHLPSNFRP